MQPSKRVTGRYNYLGADGHLLYWKERIEPGPNGRGKEFRFYHGARTMGRGGEPVLLHLPDVLAAKAVIVTEGEKQADLLKSWGLAATTLDSGANSRITPEMVDALTGKRVAILRDNDLPGLGYAERIAKALRGKSESIRIVLLPGLPDKGDICDWVKVAGPARSSLLSIIKATPEWKAPKEEEKPQTTRRLQKTSNDIMEVTSTMIETAKAFPIDSLIEFTGGNACCFVHDEKTGSLHHYKAKNRAHCFGCGADMDPIEVLRLRDGMSFVDAVKSLQGGA